MVRGAYMRNRIDIHVSDKFFTGVLYVVMILFCITTVYPFFYLLSLSLSSANVSYTQINIIPFEITFEAYRRVLRDEYVWLGFWNTLLRTVLGTLTTLFVTLLMAYPLSKRHLPHRAFWTGLVVFTMYFHGGLIPTYLLIKKLDMFNSIWVLVLPCLINTFHLIIVRNFFMSIPDSLEESAHIDGANDVVILFLIILPVSLPIVATLAMWTAVWHWNAWFDALLYVPDVKKQVLQNVMRRLVLDGVMEVNATDDTLVNPENIKAATIMVATVPIILVYPFIQKYFVKGVMVGSVKG